MFLVFFKIIDFKAILSGQRGTFDSDQAGCILNLEVNSEGVLLMLLANVRHRIKSPVPELSKMSFSSLMHDFHQNNAFSPPA